MNSFHPEITGKRHIFEQAFFHLWGQSGLFQQVATMCILAITEQLFPQWRSLGCECEWQALSMWGWWIDEPELLKAQRICNPHSLLSLVTQRKLELTGFMDCRAFKDSKGKKKKTCICPFNTKSFLDVHWEILVLKPSKSYQRKKIWELFIQQEEKGQSPYVGFHSQVCMLGFSWWPLRKYIVFIVKVSYLLNEAHASQRCLYIIRKDFAKSKF